jgi:sugar transferase (PEP-CTERM/EpsH1 system associated)
VNDRTAAKGALLMLVHRVPYPPDKGDKIRSFNLLRFLAANGWQVHLCALADDPADLKHKKALEKFCASVSLQPIKPKSQKIKSLAAPLQGLPLSARYFYRPALQRSVDDVLSRHPIKSVLCFCGPMAEYIFRNKTRPLDSAVRPQLVMDLVDVDSDKWYQYAKKKSGPMKWLCLLESRLLRAYEQKVVNSFDATILVSEDEAEMLRRRAANPEKIHGIANGVDLDYFSPAEGAQPSPPWRIVFCGVMDYFPNVDAVCWFAREVLPLVRERVGEVQFDIVGGKPSEEVQSLAKLPGVRVTGRVEDVRPYVRAADLSVAPIRIARGLQNKVLEAMAMGKAVLSTPEAFEGIEASPGWDLCVALAEPNVFAEAAVNLLQDPVKRKEMGLRARKTVEGGYCWETRLEGLNPLLAPIQDHPAKDKEVA